MRMTTIHAQAERKRQDRSVCRAEKRLCRARMLRVRGLIHPTSAVCATTDTARGEKRLPSEQNQAILKSSGRPLGECRMKRHCCRTCGWDELPPFPVNLGRIGKRGLTWWADHSYRFSKVSKDVEARNVVPVIPMRRSRKLRVAVDRTLYRLRTLIERCLNKLKSARRVATRYDKTAESFLCFFDTTSIRLWLGHLSA